MSGRKKGTRKVTLTIGENLQKMSDDTGIAPEQLLKIVTENLDRTPTSFVQGMRDGKDVESTILKSFDCATIGKGVLEDIEETLGLKGFRVDETNCEANVASAGNIRFWVNMNATINGTPKSINVDSVDVDIEPGNVQVIYDRYFEKLSESRKEQIEKQISENQESLCEGLTDACEDFDLSLDDMNLSLTVQSEDLESAPKAAEVSKVFDKICK